MQFIYQLRIPVTLLITLLLAVATGCDNEDEGDGPKPVNLDSASKYVVLGKSAVSTTGVTDITGKVGVSPAADTFLTGFSETLDSSTEFSRSSLVTGKLYASNYGEPTPTNLTTAILDMESAYDDAAGRTNPDQTELGAGNIDGRTLKAGLYKWSTGVLIPISLKLSGGENDVWIFQIAQDLTVNNGAIVTLAGGARARNIFWQVAGQAVLGTTSRFKGTILCKTNIVIQTGAVLNGRALAQTEVSMDAATVK